MYRTNYPKRDDGCRYPAVGYVDQYLNGINQFSGLNTHGEMGCPTPEMRSRIVARAQPGVGYPGMTSCYSGYAIPPLLQTGCCDGSKYNVDGNIRFTLPLGQYPGTASGPNTCQRTDTTPR